MLLRGRGGHFSAGVLRCDGGVDSPSDAVMEVELNERDKEGVDRRLFSLDTGAGSLLGARGVPGRAAGSNCDIGC